jgi:hypothetical protein
MGIGFIQSYTIADALAMLYFQNIALKMVKLRGYFLNL